MIFCKICGENLRKADGSCISSVPLFSETVNKEFCSALGVQSVVLANLLSKLGIVLNTASQQDDHFACKKCSRKIVNCYKLFSELYKSFGYSTLEENLRSRSLERSPTGLTPDSKRQKIASANTTTAGKQARKSRKALFDNGPDHYSTVNDEVYNLMNICTDAPDDNLPPVVKVGTLVLNAKFKYNNSAHFFCTVVIYCCYKFCIISFVPYIQTD
jgi:hypothetical protein